MSKVYILPYLRKGLAKEITDHTLDGLRAGFTVKADLRGKKAGSPDDAPEVKIPAFVKELSLAGPVDVRTVSELAISEIVPEDNSVGYSFGYMPYIEFYEEDFPWRYTPLKESQGKLVPWLLLLACKDDEFTLEKDNMGFRRVTFDPKGENFYPKVGEFYKLAHVQVTAPDWLNVVDNEGKIDSEKVADYVVQNPDDGISRLFCYRKLEAKTHYTMFLVPAFELGRRAGMGEPLEGADYKQLAWDDKSGKLSFPVYYQWSFKTGGETFIDLARKQFFISDDDFKALPDGLKLDIQETGLKEYRKYTEAINEDKVLVDMPTALVKQGFDESKLVDEVPSFKRVQLNLDELQGRLTDAVKQVVGKQEVGKQKVGEQSGVTLKVDSIVHMTDELRKLQLMSPVFNQNADDLNDGKTDFSEQKDPWVVPPVYGARHILATKEDFNSEKLFLNKLNLRFRNRAAAGLGVSVVKRNQESFVNRAWGMIDTINAANQQIREYYEAVKANGAASKKATSLRYFQFKPYASGLQADAAIRVANAQSAANVNAVDLAMDLADPAVSNLSIRSSVFQPIVKASGISVDELDVISNRKYWEQNWAEIVRASDGYKFLKGEIPFFEGGIDERFDFLRPIFTVDHPATINLTQEQGQKQGSISVVPGDDKKVLRFRCENMADCLPARSPFYGIKDYMEVIGWLDDRGTCFFRDGHVWWINCIDTMISSIEWSKSDYEKRWGESMGTKLHQMSLPVRTTVYDGGTLVGYAFFMREQSYEPFKSDYPNGFYFSYLSSSSSYKLFILPQERFDEVEEGSVVFSNNGRSVPVVRDQEQDGRFMPETDHMTQNTALNYSPDATGRDFFLWGLRNHMIKDSDYYVLWRTLLEKEGEIAPFITVIMNVDSVLYNSGKMKSGTVRRLWLEWGTGNTIRVMGDYYTHSKKKKWGGRTYYYDTHGFWISKSDECVITKPSLPNVVLVDTAKLMKKVREWMSCLDWVDDIFWSPNCAKLKSSSLKNLKEVTADEVGKIEEKTKNMDKFFSDVCAEADKFREILDAANLLPKTDEVATSEDLDPAFEEEKLIDADEENLKRLVELANKFADRGMSLDLSISNFDGKYPIMAYPIFPDPTSFYLRELSERFILPSVDKLKLNSISYFVTNPIFEEAFLAGMNTEMGRELLWREYPTDERGSYFRKFWDQVELPSEFSKGYFDVKYLHNWNKRLGANHEDGKGQLVVFIIKSELMMQYPQTGITLSRPSGGVLDPVLAPTMTGWLADDTYMAGFDISKLDTTQGLYLTFTETDKSQRFSQVPLSGADASGDLSSLFAIKHKNDGSVWGHEVKASYLVVNNLHLDDDEESGHRVGDLDSHVFNEGDLTLDQRHDLDTDIRPEFKR